MSHPDLIALARVMVRQPVWVVPFWPTFVKKTVKRITCRLGLIRR